MSVTAVQFVYMQKNLVFWKIQTQKYMFIIEILLY